MDNFVDRLITAIKEKNSPIVVGLDPKLDFIPSHIIEKYNNAGEAIYEFNKGLIDALYDIVPAVKPQLAYYEMYGLDGIAAFKDTVDYAKEKGLIVIADGKRNDIGSTAEAYSKAYLSEGVFDVDCLTVNPYLGIDGIQPFMDDCKNNGRGIFVLVKTSNKSSGQLQDLKLEDGRTIYEVVAGLVDKWGEGTVGKYGYSSVGAVVGATYPEQAIKLREIMKKAYILVPGYGAQGGTADDAAKNFNSDGLGAIVSASRSVMCAYRSEKWDNHFDENAYAEAARAEAIDMREALNKAIAKKG